MDSTQSYEVGLYMYHGVEGWKQDKDKAIKYLRKAALAGSLCAQAKCLLLTRLGRDLSDDQRYETAVQLYRRALDNGDISAMYGLAKCYLKGKGVRRDERRAQHMIMQAVSLGCAVAEKQMHILVPQSLQESWTGERRDDANSEICENNSVGLNTGRVHASSHAKPTTSVYYAGQPSFLHQLRNISDPINVAARAGTPSRPTNDMVISRSEGSALMVCHTTSVSSAKGQEKVEGSTHPKPKKSRTKEVPEATDSPPNNKRRRKRNVVDLSCHFGYLARPNIETNSRCGQCVQAVEEDTSDDETLHKSLRTIPRRRYRRASRERQACLEKGAQTSIKREADQSLDDDLEFSATFRNGNKRKAALVSLEKARQPVASSTDSDSTDEAEMVSARSPPPLATQLSYPSSDSTRGDRRVEQHSTTRIDNRASPSDGSLGGLSISSSVHPRPLPPSEDLRKQNIKGLRAIIEAEGLTVDKRTGGRAGRTLADIAADITAARQGKKTNDYPLGAGPSITPTKSPLPLPTSEDLTMLTIKELRGIIDAEQLNVNKSSGGRTGRTLTDAAADVTAARAARHTAVAESATPRPTAHSPSPTLGLRNRFVSKRSYLHEVSMSARQPKQQERARKGKIDTSAEVPWTGNVDQELVRNGFDALLASLQQCNNGFSKLDSTLGALVAREAQREDRLAALEAQIACVLASNDAMRNACVVCLQRPKDVVFSPCGHFRVCCICAEPMLHCPVCSVLVQGKLQLLK